MREKLVRLLIVLGTLLLGRRGRRAAERPPAPDPAETISRDAGSHDQAELIVAAALLLAAGGGAAFVVLYVVHPDTQLLGLCLGGALLALGIAAAVAARHVFPREQASEAYPDFRDPAQAKAAADEIASAGEGVSRRGLLGGAAATAGLALGAAVAVPVASLGPAVGDRPKRSPWRAGMRLVDGEGVPLRADAIELDTFRSAYPDGVDRDTLGAPVIVVRVDPARLRLPPGRRDAAPEGLLAFSKICPHAGCAVSIFRTPKFDPTEPGPALVCPCHYSTFDPLQGGRRVFGPAGRALPLLPLRIDDARELEAAGDFLDPVGPSYGGILL